MKVSIFTGTHDPRWLGEAYASIKDQPFDEWVIMPNNGTTFDDVLSIEGFRQEQRIKLIQWSSRKGPQHNPNNVGSIKNQLGYACEGDVLVELDHDDELAPKAVEKVTEAFKNPGVAMAYSHCFSYNDNGNGNRASRTYGAKCGWSVGEFDYKGQKKQYAISPPPKAHNCALVWYGPNHVRAYRSDIYKRIGGHNPELKVLDDQELTCRMFLEGAVHMIPEVLYYYRVHGDNTWLQDGIMGPIQTDTLKIQQQYIARMCEAEIRRSGELMLDLCSAKRIGGLPPGYKTVDVVPPADYVADLNERWPFEDSSVALIRAYDAIEHLRDPVHTMQEAYRVLRPGGYFLSMTPSTCGPNGESGMGAYQDPTHVSFWNRNSFWYWTRKEQAHFINNIECKFYPMVLRNMFLNRWHRENFIPYVQSYLISLKDGYRPHGVIEW